MKKDYTQLVGYMTGQIMVNSHPLLIALYVESTGNCHTRVWEDKTSHSALAAAESIVRAHPMPSVTLFQSSAIPPWFFVQLNPDFTPNDLFEFSLPWSSVQTWFNIKAFAR